MYNSKVTVVATKQWIDADGNDIEPGKGTATPEVKLQLFKNGKAEGEPKTIPSAASATAAQMSASWADLPSFENGKRVDYNVEETVGELDGYVVETHGSTNTIVKDGKVLFVNKLSPFYSTSSTDDPNTVIKVTYVDHLLGEDGKGGSLKTSRADEELVLVFKTRLGDLNTEVLNTVGAELSKGTVYTESSNNNGEVKAESSKAEGEAEAESEDAKVKAEATAQGMKVPADKDSASHAGWTFSGWTINRDKFGDYVMVAHHTKNTHTTYVDGQTGETWTEKPGDPSHDGMKFVGWKQVTDEAGNTIYVAQYEPIAKETTTPAATRVVTASPATAGGAYLSTSPLAKTGDDTSYVPVIVLIVAAAGAVGAAAFIRRRK